MGIWFRRWLVFMFSTPQRTIRTTIVLGIALLLLMVYFQVTLLYLVISHLLCAVLSLIAALLPVIVLVLIITYVMRRIFR